MSAQRPSDELKNKINVNPSVNRLSEATADDFIELSGIFNDHADILDQLSGDLHHADFQGYYGSIAVLEAQIPSPSANDFAVLVDGFNVPQKIIKVQAGQWVEQTNEELIQYYPNRPSFPTTGLEKIWYVAQDSKKTYLWFNSVYNEMNPATISGVAYTPQAPTPEQQAQAQENIGLPETLTIDSQEFKRKKGYGNAGAGIENGDLAQNGYIVVVNDILKTDLICIDETKDLTTMAAGGWERVGNTYKVGEI